MPPLMRAIITAQAGPGTSSAGANKPKPAAWRTTAASTYRAVTPPGPRDRAAAALAAAPPPLTAAAAAVGAWCAMSLLNRLTGKG